MNGVHPPSGFLLFLDRVAGSSWRLLVLILVGLVLPLGFVYVLRGLRGVMLSAGGLGGAVLLLAGFSRPFETLALSLFVFFSGLDAYLPGPVALGLIALVNARLGFDVLGGRRLHWGSPTFKVSLMILLGIALTSLLVARSMELARGPLLGILWGTLYYVGISAYASHPSRLRALFTLMPVAFALSVVLLLINIMKSGNLLLLLLQKPGEYRVGVGDANFTAVVACALLPPLVHVMGGTSLVRRFALTLITVLLVAVVILSISRIGMALLAVSLFTMTFRARRWRPVAVLGLSLLGMVLLSLPPQYWVRFTDLGQFGGILIDRSLRLRQHALEAGWEIFCEHPWLGVGLGNFSAESPRYMSRALWAHNTYLDVAATLGIFGLIAFLLWQGSALFMVARASRLWGVSGYREGRSLCFAIGLSLILVYMAELTLDLAFLPLVWILMGGANAAQQTAEAGSQ